MLTLKLTLIGVVVLFFGLMATVIVSGIVGHFTCDWLSQSSWATWRDECPAARVGSVAVMILMCLVVLFVFVSITLTLIVKMFGADCVGPSCDCSGLSCNCAGSFCNIFECCRRRQYLQV